MEETVVQPHDEVLQAVGQRTADAEIDNTLIMKRILVKRHREPQLPPLPSPA